MYLHVTNTTTDSLQQSIMHLHMQSSGGGVHLLVGGVWPTRLPLPLQDLAAEEATGWLLYRVLCCAGMLLC